MVNLDVAVSDEDSQRLSALIGTGDTPRVTELILKAGAAEALGYATGRAVFSTMTDLRSFRVFCLLEAGMTLDESEKMVATLFKLSPAGARRVVGSTLARYSYELRDGVDAAVQVLLESAVWVDDPGRWEVQLPVGFARDRALELCRSSDKPNPEARRGFVWQFAHETYNWLRVEVHLPTRSQPAP